MRRSLIGLCVLALVVAFAVPAFAGGTINKSNLSIEYFRMLARNAATDNADIVAYNPAGTVKMEDGLYTNLSFQYLIEKNYKNNFNDLALGISEHETTEPSLIPAFYSVYGSGPWAGFFGVNVPVGGGKVDYGEGNLITYQVGSRVAALSGGALTGHQIEAESFGVGYTFGGAYQINDMYSFSLAARYIDAKVEMDGSADIAGGLAPGTKNIAFDADADGWGWIAGFDIFPNEALTIGLRYESRTELEYKYDVSEDTAGVLPALNIVTGAKKRDDLPATLAAGASYQFNEKLRGEINFTYYFNTDANIGGTTLREQVTDQTTGQTQALEDAIDNGWEIGLGAEYSLTETLKLSAGYLFTKIGVDAQYSSKFLPDLDSHTIGFGCQWTVRENLFLNFAAGNVFYVSDSYRDNTLSALGQGNMEVEYEKNIPYLGFGIQYKFF